MNKFKHSSLLQFALLRWVNSSGRFDMTQRHIQEQKSFEQHRPDNVKSREINIFQICVPNIRNNYYLYLSQLKGPKK